MASRQCLINLAFTRALSLRTDTAETACFSRDVCQPFDLLLLGTRSRTSTAKGGYTSSDRENAPASKAIHSADTSPDLEDDRDFKLSGKGKPRSKLRSLQGPHKPDEDIEMADEEPPRRSGRPRNPPKRGAYVSEAIEKSEQAGFHFIAYMPIKDHVWKMDGLDYHPHDMGTFGVGGNGADGGTGNWMHVVAPALQNRMEAAQDQGEISFTLLAVSKGTVRRHGLSPMSHSTHAHWGAVIPDRHC